jgi:hypothetical protein
MDGPRTRAEWVAWASPPCRRCGRPVERVETRYEAVAFTAPTDASFRVGPTFLVCAAGCRVRVDPGDPENLGGPDA